jgi:hypothetical protein
LIPNVDRLINVDEETYRLWNDWASDAIYVNDALEQGGETARKVKDTEVAAFWDTDKPIETFTYENQDDFFTAFCHAMGALENLRTRPTILIGTLSEGEEVPCKDKLDSWGITFRNIPGLAHGDYLLFDGSMELLSRKHEAVFNIRGARAEIKRKDEAK